MSPPPWVLEGDARLVRQAWRAGRPVGGPELEALGADDYLLHGEWGLAWRLCEVPSPALPRWAPWHVAAKEAGGAGEEAERFAAVRDWYAAEGGPLGATARSPLICLVGAGGGLELADGWHRAAVAANEHGGAAVHALVAPVPPGFYDG